MRIIKKDIHDLIANLSEKGIQVEVDIWNPSGRENKYRLRAKELGDIPYLLNYSLTARECYFVLITLLQGLYTERKIVYKVVNRVKKLNCFCSYNIVDSNFFAESETWDSDLEASWNKLAKKGMVTYFFGTTTFPCFGKLFAFNTLESVREWMSTARDIKANAILVGTTTETELPVERSIPSNPSRYKDFWGEKVNQGGGTFSLAKGSIFIPNFTPIAELPLRED